MILIGDAPSRPNARGWSCRRAIARRPLKASKPARLRTIYALSSRRCGFARADLEMRVIAARMATTELGQ